MAEISCMFWNVDNLYPYIPGQTGDYWPSSQAAYDSKIQDVASVIRGAPGGVPDLVLLCELASLQVANGYDVLDDLAQALGGPRQRHLAREGDVRGITCGAIWHGGRIDDNPAAHALFAVDSPVTVGEYGRPILKLALSEAATGQQFTVYVNHWTARNSSDSARREEKRKQAGECLIKLVQDDVCTGYGHSGNADALVLAVGDFNDEPFNESMVDPTGLAGRPFIVRDRTAALARQPYYVLPVLYNPTWRLMGEVQTVGEQLASSREMPAGTYIFEEVAKAKWGNYDQVLVSAAMVKGPSPVFDDGTLKVHCPLDLVGPDGTPQMTSDHFPIVFSLNFE